MNDDQYSEYFCTVEWHLARLGPCARLVYPFARRLSRESRVFFCSAQNLANYFGYEERQIRRALAELEQAGLFVVVSKRPFRTNEYKVLTHDEWAEQHPDQCTERMTFPWSGEGGDDLGRRLYAASRGKVKLLPNQTKWLRACGLSDDVIVEQFVRFLEHWHPRGSWERRRYLIHRFVDVLRGLAVEKGFGTSDDPELDVLVFRIYKTTGFVFGHIDKEKLGRLLEHYAADSIAEGFREYLSRLDPKRRAYVDPVGGFLTDILTAA